MYKRCPQEIKLNDGNSVVILLLANGDVFDSLPDEKYEFQKYMDL